MIFTALTVGICALLAAKAAEKGSKIMEVQTRKHLQMAKAKSLGLREDYEAQPLRFTREEWQRLVAASQGGDTQVISLLHQDRKVLPGQMQVVYLHAKGTPTVAERIYQLRIAQLAEVRRQASDLSSPLGEAGQEEYVVRAQQRLLGEFISSCVIEGDIS